MVTGKGQNDQDRVDSERSNNLLLQTYRCCQCLQEDKRFTYTSQLLQHSNMIVTLNYLRGLGEVSNNDLMNDLPDL